MIQDEKITKKILNQTKWKNLKLKLKNLKLAKQKFRKLK